MHFANTGGLYFILGNSFLGKLIYFWLFVTCYVYNSRV